MLEYPWGIRVLHDLLRREALDIVFLLETKLLGRQLEGIRRQGSFVVCLGLTVMVEGGVLV